MCAVYQSMKCCRVFRDGFPRQSTTYRGFPLYSVLCDGKHAMPRWELKKHAHDMQWKIMENVKKHAVPSACQYYYTLPLTYTLHTFSTVCTSSGIESNGCFVMTV